MRLATSLRVFLLLVVVCTFPGAIKLRAQVPQKRPAVGVALYGGTGALSASSIGFLKALDEDDIPVDMISGSGASTLVAALYATGKTPKEIEDAFGEYKDIFLKNDFEGDHYSSDYTMRRFLAQKFAKFDLIAGDTSPQPPIPLLTSGLDLSTGELVQVQMRLAEAVRVSFASPSYLEPVKIGGRMLIGETSGQVAGLRKGGADIVIAFVDASFDFDRAFVESGYKPFVTEAALKARNRDSILRDLATADVVIRDRNALFSTLDTGSTHGAASGDVGLSGIVERGRRSVRDKELLVRVFAVDKDQIAKKRDALNAYYSHRAGALDGLMIDSVELQGNRYLNSKSLLQILNLKAGIKFDLDVALKSLDRVYATGFLSRCSFEFQRPQQHLVRIVLDVKESEFLPLDSLPRLEAAIKVSKETDDDEDDDDSDDPDPLFAAIAIGNLGPSAKHAIPKLASLLQDTLPVLRTAAVQALGAMGREAKSELRDIVALLTIETDANVRREAARAIARISAPLFSEQDLDALDPLESAAGILSSDSRLAEYASSVHLSLTILKNVQASFLATRGDTYVVSEPGTRSLLSSSGEASLNGVSVELDVSADRSHIQFLGPEAKNAIHQGINRLVRGKEELLFWMEERKLMKYQSPYQNSFAVVVAIDDYDRKKDSHYGGPTGYHALSEMVASAQALTDVLIRVGFPKKNITTLYDDQATSAAVQSVLASFWPGGKNASADRLFFYFGGHGDKYSDSLGDKGRTIPYLVTYDFDNTRPTQTAILMQDLADRDSRNISAHHVLFALDACDSGLTLSGLGNPEAVDQQVRRFQALSLIRRDTENVARNLMVAGTGDQQALWQNGGLFTRALIDGLKGEADLNSDGVIQFEELGVYIRNRVTAQAAQAQVRQDPDFRVLDQYGPGRMLFVK